MNNNSIKSIGKIIEVRGIKAKAEFYRKLPPHIITNGDIFPAPQINSYVKSNVGLDTIICQISGEYEEFLSDHTQKHIVELEIRGRITNNKFLSGLRLLPFVGANVDILNESEYNKVFSKPSYSIDIGKNLYDNSNRIYLDINKLIPSHIGIFGNTGSGKSNTLAKILKEYLLNLENIKSNNAKIILFDINNEYGGDSITSKEKKKIYKLSTSKEMNESEKLPFNYLKLTYEDMGIVLKATEKTQLPVVKKAFERMNEKFNESEYYGINILKNILVNKDSTKFFVLRKYINNYVKNGISNICYHSSSHAFYYQEGNTKNFINSFQDIKQINFEIPNDWLDRFELELTMQVAIQSESGINFEYISPLLSRIAARKKDFNKIFKKGEGNIIDMLFGQNNLSVIQLSNVNKEIREIVPSLFSGILYKEQKELKDDNNINSILNIVIDEAHNLLSNDNEKTEIHSNTLNVFEEIIKEGRKFGVYMMISSQRPSDISNTITSQLHNYFIHKLVNPNDIEKIRKTVSFMSDSSLNMLTMLGQGECIISGTALYMPQYVCIDELDSNNKPHSNDVILLGKTGILKF